jgi:hypothetical protein
MTDNNEEPKKDWKEIRREQVEFIHKELDSLGITMECEFVPFSKSRNAKETKKDTDFSINWKVTIERGTRSFTTDYMQGIGHLPESMQRKGKYCSLQNFELIKYGCETGKVGFISDYSTVGGVLSSPSKQRLKPPTIEDVLYSLLMDSEVLNYSTFKDWADEFGYNSDSIKDKKVYEECLRIALQMRQLFSDVEINNLNELFQDF